MLSIEKINELQAQLAFLLPNLINGTIPFIEYGDSEQACGSFMSHLRIRYLKTPGGSQFCLKRVSHHVEGSGHYTPSQQEIVEIAMNAVLHYHRPTAHQLRLNKLATLNLNWFAPRHADYCESERKAVSMISYRLQSIRDEEFPGMQTLTLS